MKPRPMLPALFAGLLGLLLTGCGVRTANNHSGAFTRGAVAADHHLASRAGADMLARGGNAVDAAVAASFTLAVVRPYSCGLGGGGFMVIHLPDDPTHGAVTTAINYRETSPVGPEFFADNDRSSTVGGTAVAVPGTIAGLLHALDTYGTLPRRIVLGPAISAGLNGFEADEHYVQAARGQIERFERRPAWKNRFPQVWETYLGSGRVEVGDVIRNKPLGLAVAGCVFWGIDPSQTDEFNRAIREAVESDGGSMPMAALEAYRPVEVEPLRATIGGVELLCMPPPSSGGTTIVQTLAVLDALGMDLRDPIDTDAERHALVEALKHAFADRSRWLADPAFEPVPVDAMLAPANIARMAAMIGDTTRPAANYGTHDALPDDAGTSHLSAVDRWGGAVACTETINLEFGSLVMAGRFGILLNNEMDDFTTRSGVANAFGLAQSDRNLPRPGVANAFGLAQSDRNLPRPGKRPLSSMSPTIVLDDRGVLLVAGASGGPRIITGTLQAILNALSGMDAGAAVTAPRLHHQWTPGVVEVEAASGWGPGLAERGHAVVERASGSVVQLIKRHRSGWQAASDPRKGGRPAGH